MVAVDGRGWCGRRAWSVEWRVCEDRGELGGGEDGDALVLAECEEVLVAGDDDIRFAGDCGCEDDVIIGVARGGDALGGLDEVGELLDFAHEGEASFRADPTPKSWTGDGPRKLGEQSGGRND